MFRLLGILILSVAAAGQTRRALLVAIDEYAPAANAPAPWKPTPLRPVPLSGAFKVVVWPKLNGAVNDLKSMHRMLLTRGVKEADIVELVNQQATADAILTRLKSHLIDRARPGDSSLFYFAGHGARIRNLHATLPSGYDVTIVPYDAPTGVPALRNKELAHIYRQVPDGVSLTVIQDNCYSSGGARGLAPPLVTREGPEDPRVVDDPWDPGMKPVDQQKNAVLVLAASQSDQKAEELDVTDQPDLTGDAGAAHGRFTFALLQAMRDSLPDESVAILFQRTRNYMHSGNSTQEPSMLGVGRGERGLFGQKAIAASAIVPMVKTVEGDTVRLDRGQATGLRPGCELRQAPDGPARLQVTKLVGLDEAEAAVRSGQVRPGDRFVVDKWIAVSGPALSVYLPAVAPHLSDLTALAPAVKQVADRLKLNWVTDPARRVPQFDMRWNGRAWELRRSGGTTVDLGAKPAAGQLAAALGAAAKGDFFLELPPPAEWLPRGLNLGEGTDNPAIAVNATSPGSAEYLLAGNWNDGAIEYAWVATNVTRQTVDAEAAHLREANVPVNVALPLRTKPVQAAVQVPYALTDYALRLAKVRGWLMLQPPVEEALPFPYRLALKEVTTGAYNTSGTVVQDQRYRVMLQADPAILAAFVQRYRNAPRGVPVSFVYVFVIDSSGSGQLVFPKIADNGIVNRLPVPGDDLPLEIPVSDPLAIDAPFGIDSYMLLTTATALGNPEVLNFEGPGQTRGVGGGPLERLLGSLGEGTRGVRIPAPADWSIARMFVRSLPK